jgi:UDP-N-acetylmuramoyl-L-alanyl-D-glutamate--2,6-diaminopimelate ligase
MQAVGGDGRPLVVVDYAHTPDALDKALATLRETAAARGGRLVCVFGCGGDRDPGKRPLMGAVAERLADRVWLTSDNPRGEDPEAIIVAIAAGMGKPPVIETDRAAAIRRAVAAADPRDVILLAGKGHEPYQEVAGRRHPFSDVEQARAALESAR